MLQRTMPTVSDLISRALLDTEFVAETPLGTTQHQLFRAATIATNQAAEAAEEEGGHAIGASVPAIIRHTVTLHLIHTAHARHEADELAERDALLDAIEAGDCGRDGVALSYVSYRSV